MVRLCMFFFSFSRSTESTCTRRREEMSERKVLFYIPGMTPSVKLTVATLGMLAFSVNPFFTLSIQVPLSSSLTFLITSVRCSWGGVPVTLTWLKRVGASDQNGYYYSHKDQRLMFWLIRLTLRLYVFSRRQSDTQK